MMLFALLQNVFYVCGANSAELPVYSNKLKNCVILIPYGWKDSKLRRIENQNIKFT